MAHIVFTDTVGIPEEYRPKPASASIPDWYKHLESYLNGKKIPDGEGKTNSTIKKCMPVFDAITAGYIIYTHTDIFVSQKDENPWYEWRSFKPISWHPVRQAPIHPNRGNLADNSSYPKFLNPWGIKTPKGYSCLFTQPMHREAPFTILDGIVDTDRYDSPVNFPFVLNDWKFEGLIPAGTPIAQVIPFKREAWQMKIGKEKDFKNQEKTARYLNTSFFDSYKNKFRSPKEYK
jgi:hypothetical protein